MDALPLVIVHGVALWLGAVVAIVAGSLLSLWLVPRLRLRRSAARTRAVLLSRAAVSKGLRDGALVSLTGHLRAPDGCVHRFDDGALVAATTIVGIGAPGATLSDSPGSLTLDVDGTCIPLEGPLLLVAGTRESASFWKLARLRTIRKRVAAVEGGEALLAGALGDLRVVVRSLCDGDRVIASGRLRQKKGREHTYREERREFDLVPEGSEIHVAAAEPPAIARPSAGAAASVLGASLLAILVLTWPGAALARLFSYSASPDAFSFEPGAVRMPLAATLAALSPLYRDDVLMQLSTVHRIQRDRPGILEAALAVEQLRGTRHLPLGLLLERGRYRDAAALADRQGDATALQWGGFARAAVGDFAGALEPLERVPRAPVASSDPRGWWAPADAVYVDPFRFAVAHLETHYGACSVGHYDVEVLALRTAIAGAEWMRGVQLARVIEAELRLCDNSAGCCSQPAQRRETLRCLAAVLEWRADRPVKDELAWVGSASRNAECRLLYLEKGGSGQELAALAETPSPEAVTEVARLLAFEAQPESGEVRPGAYPAYAPIDLVLDSQTVVESEPAIALKLGLASRLRGMRDLPRAARRLRGVLALSIAAFQSASNHHTDALDWIAVAEADLGTDPAVDAFGEKVDSLRFMIELRAGDPRRARVFRELCPDAPGSVERNAQVGPTSLGVIGTIRWPVATGPVEPPGSFSFVRGVALARLLVTPAGRPPVPDVAWWRDGIFDRHGLGAAADLAIAAEHLGDPEAAGDLGRALPRLYEAAMRRESVVPLAVLRSF